ncbi:hypothetical protein [Pseudooceanicola aestuarii]|uniref:hypothetical protein n=1 Tax=Pseudooceanicola aestuarii TaxID=2697319 RepID=UPI001EF77180|nr:hypothetical protein [Pseudooceanicola aestuarii]
MTYRTHATRLRVLLFPLLLATLLAVLPRPGQAQAGQAIYTFHWIGGNGYEMRGAMSFPDALAQTPQVIEHDVQCFQIAGTYQGAPLGHWGLGLLEEDSSWRLTFDPLAEAFAVFGAATPMPQAWNMDGAGTDCGTGGFGFNIGNAAQDLCHDGALLVPSQVPPGRPFAARRVERFEFAPHACRAPLLMSRLSPRR